MSKFKFGDPVTNICAGDGNPHRLSYFVKQNNKSHKNRWGITHIDRLIQCTDQKGHFWDTDQQVIYPGHLSLEKSAELFKPIWEKEFGRMKG